MNPQKFVDELKEVFWRKNKLLQFNSRQQDSIFDTIKAFLQKKNLVIVSKVEYDDLILARDKQRLKDLSSETNFY